MKKFSLEKKFTNEKFSENAFKNVPHGTKGEMKMRTLSVTFENFTNENAMEIYKRNEKIFITIENLSNVKTFTNVKEENVSIEKNFTWYYDEMETLSLQKKIVTFVYKITDESATKCKIFLDLLLEMDAEFTFVI